MIIFLDIETIPTSDPDVIASLETTIKPPATHKKQETIDAWMAENKEQALKELVSKTSFDSILGRIACISWAIDDGAIESTGAGNTEQEILERLFDAIPKNKPVTFCGHNIAGFDLPFIKHRAIINNVKMPEQFKAAAKAKPWGDEIADTMLMWSTDPQKRTSMDKLCKALGIQGKDGFDGSMVAETWPVDPMKVIAYCMDDVARTRKIYNRIK